MKTSKPKAATPSAAPSPTPSPAEPLVKTPQQDYEAFCEKYNDHLPPEQRPTIEMGTWAWIERGQKWIAQSWHSEALAAHKGTPELMYWSRIVSATREALKIIEIANRGDHEAFFHAAALLIEIRCYPQPEPPDFYEGYPKDWPRAGVVGIAGYKRFSYLASSAVIATEVYGAVIQTQHNLMIRNPKMWHDLGREKIVQSYPTYQPTGERLLAWKHAAAEAIQQDFPEIAGNTKAIEAIREDYGLQVADERHRWEEQRKAAKPAATKQDGAAAGVGPMKTAKRSKESDAVRMAKAAELFRDGKAKSVAGACRILGENQSSNSRYNGPVKRAFEAWRSDLGNKAVRLSGQAVGDEE